MISVIKIEKERNKEETSQIEAQIYGGHAGCKNEFMKIVV